MIGDCLQKTLKKGKRRKDKAMKIKVKLDEKTD